MTKHMPDVPAANRSKKGPGGHREVGSATQRMRIAPTT
jgi:hypothetical protein